MTAVNGICQLSARLTEFYSIGISILCMISGFHSWCEWGIRCSAMSTGSLHV